MIKVGRNIIYPSSLTNVINNCEICGNIDRVIDFDFDFNFNINNSNLWFRACHSCAEKLMNDIKIELKLSAFK